MRPTTTNSPQLALLGRDLVTNIAEELTARLGLHTCRFEAFPFDALLPRIEPGRIVIPAAEPVARSYAEWRPAQGVELPVRYGSLTLGRFVLVPSASTCGIAIPPADRAAAIRLARAVGDALGRQWTHANPRESAERGPVVADLLFLAILTAFFALAVVFVHACERIIGPDLEAEASTDVTESERAAA